MRRDDTIRNLTCLLPDGCIGVKLWAPHPCGGLYVRDAYCYGPNGRIGMWMETDGPDEAQWAEFQKRGKLEPLEHAVEGKRRADDSAIGCSGCAYLSSQLAEAVVTRENANARCLRLEGENKALKAEVERLQSARDRLGYR